MDSGYGGGGLPITGAGILTFAGLSLNSLWIAVIGAALVVGGVAVLRLARPVQVSTGQLDAVRATRALWRRRPGQRRR